MSVYRIMEFYGFILITIQVVDGKLEINLEWSTHYKIV